jgi:hypothetical protein
MDAKHIHITIERYSFVQTNGDIEEHVVYVLRNDGNSPFSLSGKYFQYILTDSENTVRTASDGLDGFLDPHVGCEFATLPSGGFLVVLRLRGQIAPQGTRVIGVQIRRRKLADVRPSEAYLGDPLTRRSFSAFSGASVEAIVVYVFPADDLRRDVSADDTKLKTTRIARWEYVPHPNLLQRRWAKALDAAVPLATFSIDDAIVEFYRVLAADAVGATYETTEAIRLLDELPATFAKDAHEARQFLLDYGTYSFEQRQMRARQLVETLHLLRERIAIAPIPQGGKHLDLVRFTTQAIHNKINQYAIPSQPPRKLAKALEHLLLFADSCRKDDPFERGVKEQDLQKRLRIFLHGASSDSVLSEVSIGRGRIDLLLYDTPLELKARKLGKNPAQAVIQHFEQAANYASDRRVAAGILVILDLTDRTHETRHGAPLSSNIDVVAVESRKAIRGTAYTALVVIVVEAFPPNPSSLGVTGKHSQSARRSGVRSDKSPRSRRKSPSKKDRT